MSNIESTHGSRYDNTGLHRKKDPGSGAFTPYHGAQTTITHAVPAGAELFASYGAEWIPDIPGAQITLNPELDAARDFVHETYWPFIQQHASKMSHRLKQGLWEFTTNSGSGSGTNSNYNNNNGVPILSRSRSFSNLPKSQPWSIVEKAIQQQQQQQQQHEQQKQHTQKTIDEHQQQIEDDEEDKEDEEEEDVVRQFIRNQSIRSIDWLNTNGYCQDHIVPGRSTIPQAGHGAFAARDLPQNTIVGYSPLIHVGTDGRQLFDIVYEEEPDDDDSDDDADDMDENSSDHREGTDRHLYDLILNYSFGHHNSTLLLTPYGGTYQLSKRFAPGPCALCFRFSVALVFFFSFVSLNRYTHTNTGMVNYINHDSKNPNIRIKWPDNELVAHKPEWLEKDIYFLRDTVGKIGLSFEYVATRNIQKGDELFMDYG